MFKKMRLQYNKKYRLKKEELEGAEMRHVGHGVSSFISTNKIKWQITNKSNDWETL